MICTFCLRRSAILAVAFVLVCIFLVAHITAEYPVAEYEKEMPIVYDRMPDEIVYIEDVCPVCGKDAIASEDYLVCNTRSARLGGSFFYFPLSFILVYYIMI